MDRKECYRLTHPLSKISSYATALACWCCVCREFRVRLSRDDAVYSRDIRVENDTHRLGFDPSRAFRGVVEGTGRSSRLASPLLGTGVVVNARRARLVPGWVTVFGRVYRLGL